MVFGVGDKVRYVSGIMTGIIINVMWTGKYYVSWDDGCYSIVCAKDIEVIR